MTVHESTAILLNGRLVERAESTAESDQIGITESLVAKQQHCVVEPRTIDLGERRVINRSEVDAANFRAEYGGGGDNLQNRAARTVRDHISDRHIEYGKIPDSNRWVEQG
jgi:hypothetical protein